MIFERLLAFPLVPTATAAFLIAAVTAFLLTPVVRTAARTLGAMDHPDARKIHSAPVPRWGGLAVYAGFLVGTAPILRFSGSFAFIALAAGVIALVGALDDLRGLSARWRLVIQVAASLAVMAGGTVISLIPHGPGQMALAWIVTLVWLVGITNALNFLDGMDGLATGLSIVTAVCLALVAWRSGDLTILIWGAALAGACVGFLPYNWKPASIFLGDSGSTTLGFLLAALAVQTTWAVERPLVAAGVPILIFAVPIFDMIYTTQSRIRNHVIHSVRDWLEYVGKDHFHHRLLNIGFTEKQTLALILAVAMALGIGGVVCRETGVLGAGLLLGQALLILGVVVALMLLGRVIG